MKNMTFKKITSQRLFLPIFCLALVLLVNIVTTPNFFAIEVRNGVLYGYLIDIINRASELVILAVGMTLVVSSSAGTDISVGAIMAVSAAVCCNLLTGGERAATAYANPLILGFLAALIVGAAIGCFNGFLVAKLNIQPMVATLIMFTAGRGIAQLITDGQITYVRVDSYRTLGASLPGFPVPTPFIVAVVVVALTSLLLKKTALGMYIQSVGINKRASQLVGIKSVMIIFLTYAYCGLCSGLSGLIASSRIYSADANNIGLNMELDAILAVAISGKPITIEQIRPKTIMPIAIGFPQRLLVAALSNRLRSSLFFLLVTFSFTSLSIHWNLQSPVKRFPSFTSDSFFSIAV